MTMFIHFFCLCPLSLVIKLNFNISKVAYCGLCVVYIQKCGATLLVGALQREKQQNKLVEWKALVDTVRIKSADLKNFVLVFCGFLCFLDVGRGRRLTYVACRLSCLATGLDAFLSSFSTSRRCSRNRSPSRLPVSPIYNFLQRVQVIQ